MSFEFNLLRFLVVNFSLVVDFSILNSSLNDHNNEMHV